MLCTPRAAGLEPSVFMHPQHLHLTLCMLKLYSEEQRELARHTLRALGPRAAGLLGGAPLAVRLKGLEYMTDDPSQVGGFEGGRAGEAGGWGVAGTCFFCVENGARRDGMCGH